MKEDAIRDKLVRRGLDKYKAPRYFVEFTGDSEANELLNDLQTFPHAFVLGCVLNRQIKGELDWTVPHRLSQRLGSFEMNHLRQLTQENLETFITEPEPMPGLTTEMGKNLYDAIRLIDEKYEGDAARIWSDRPSSGELVYRFLQFRGVGPKIANRAANILARQFRIPLADYYSIDISADAHIKRVFTRLGLVPEKASSEQLIFKARALHPEFPGILNLPSWEIGYNWCLPVEPRCAQCYMNDLCPTASQEGD
ncbi:iron-sulfur cluster loop [Acidobacteria bacterium AH-259-D05]|nr:iron-sulfur cluster loop [Acidobacteria bacterium AH-259-D05]